MSLAQPQSGSCLTSSAVCLLQDQYPAYQVEPHVPQHGPKYEHKSVPFDATTTNQVWVNAALCLSVIFSMLLPSADTLMGCIIQETHLACSSLQCEQFAACSPAMSGHSHSNIACKLQRLPLLVIL